MNLFSNASGIGGGAAGGGGSLFGGSKPTGTTTGGGLFGTNTGGTTGGATSGGLFGGNKPAGTTTGGLFGGNTAGTGTNTTTGGLFGGNKPAGTTTTTTTGGLFGGGAGAGTATTTGGLFGGNTAGAGAGTGTTTGGLFGGTTGGATGATSGGLFGGGATNTAGAGNYSINAPINPNHENDFNRVLENFYNALNVNNPVSCRLKYPIYQVNNQPGMIMPDIDQYRDWYEPAILEEAQKNLPPSTSKRQYFVSYVCGVETLEKRIKTVADLFDKLNEAEVNLRTKQDDLLKKYDAKLKEDINRIKRKNYILLDKLLTVHSLLEKVALQYNECNRKPNEEMALHNRYVTLEAIPNEIQTRLLDIRLNRENVRLIRPSNMLSHSMDSNSKRNVLDLLAKMKRGVEILNKTYQEDAADVEQMLKYAENKGRTY